MARQGMEIRMLGPVRVLRDGQDVPLPQSRKVRVLLAVLALEPAPASRSRLCDLLWDAADDPRGELRWCLSKLRGVLDDDSRQRVVTAGQSTVALDLEGCLVDVLEVDRAIAAGLATATTQRLDEICALIGGDFLDGLQVDGAELSGWLIAQRQRYRSHHVAILRELAMRAPVGDDKVRRLEAWLQHAAFDQAAHEMMIEALVGAARFRDAEDHVTGAIRVFEREGVDWAPLRSAWQSARAAAAPLPARIEALAAAGPPHGSTAAPARRGSIAVMPFAATTGTPDVANGLTDDIITRLAKLRALFVIARGTAYALRDRGVDAREAGRILDVEYVVSGVVRRHGERLAVVVELVEAARGIIVWTDEIEVVFDETLSVLDSIVDRVVATIAEEVERAECKRAIIKPPSSLDAWEAYHRGLWHMYRFTGPDNESAARFFRDSLQVDPGFARAHAGLSFTHFQNVFLGLAPDRDRELALALATAEQSLAADDRDPAAHWAMGRALWLGGDHRGSIAELESSVELSPNFALGHYTLGFVHAQSGDPTVAIEATEYSRQLSPFDPLQFGMLASRALAHMRLGERDAAADWAVKAANRPNAHAHILAIAATNLARAGRRDQARDVVTKIRARQPSYTVDHFVRAFHLTPDAEQMVREAAGPIDFG
jgi:DNA-binding SARP family transcriptional activator/TolB-like protein